MHEVLVVEIINNHTNIVRHGEILGQMKRIDGLDIIKAVAILMVISLHVPLWNPNFMEYHTFATVLQYADRLISGGGVPLFMAVNGFLLLKRETVDLKKHFLKVKKCLGLLVFWGFVLSSFGLLMVPQGNVWNINNILSGVLQTQVGSEYTGVLWFMQYLIAVYLIYPIIWYVFQKNYRLFQWLFAVTIFFSVGIVSLQQFEHLLTTRTNTEYFLLFIGYINKLNPVGDIWCMFYFMYFMLGGVIWKNFDYLKGKRSYYVIAGLVAWAVAVVYGVLISVLSGSTYDPSYCFGSISTIFFIIGFFALVTPYQNRNSMIERFLLSIGQNTFGIYFMHYIFIFLILHFWDYNAMNSFEYRLIAYLMVFVCSYTASYVLKKIPYIKRFLEL